VAFTPLPGSARTDLTVFMPFRNFTSVGDVCGQVGILERALYHWKTTCCPTVSVQPCRGSRSSA
jgi:hypothetical protein